MDMNIYDVMVAQKIFRDFGPDPNQKGPSRKGHWYWIEGEGWRAIHFSRSYKAMWTLVKRLDDTHYIEMGNTEDNGWYCWLKRRVGKKEETRVESDTLPKAVTLASLRAYGVSTQELMDVNPDW